MRYLIMLKTGSEKPSAPTPELMAALGKLTEDVVKAGKLVETGGMQAAASGTTLHLASGKVTVTDGPFTEANEIVGGYAIMDLESKEEAVAMARQFLEIHARVLGPSYTVESEIRRIYVAVEPGRSGGRK